MRKIILIIIIGISFLVLKKYVRADGPKSLFVNSIVNCIEYPNSLLNWTLNKFERKTETNYTFEMTLTVLKEVSNDLAIVFNLWKCETEGNWDSCEYILKDQKNDDICMFLEEENQFWSPFIDSFQPKLKCPVKPGIYKANYIPIGSDYLEMLPIQQPVIRARLVGYDGKMLISCVDIELVFSREKRAG